MKSQYKKHTNTLLGTEGAAGAGGAAWWAVVGQAGPGRWLRRGAGFVVADIGGTLVLLELLLGGEGVCALEHGKIHALFLA